MARAVRNTSFWQRTLLVALLLAALVAAAVFGTRAYRSFAMLRSAHEVGASDPGSIRGWMTLHQIAQRYHVPEPALLEQLGLPPDTPRDAPLRALARRQDQPIPEFMQEVRRAVDALRRDAPAPGPPPGRGSQP